MTDVAARLDEVERLFVGERERALDALWDLVEEAPDAATLAALTARVGHAHPRLGAELAIAAGSLVEDGFPGDALGRAIVEPMRRALDNAARLLDHVAHLPDAEPPADGEDDETEDDHPGTEMIGTKRVDHATLDAIAARDRVSVQSWGSLALWYRPAAAVWSRDPALLREAQANAGLRAAVARLGPATETSYWLSLLLETLYDARFVFLFPETGEAWTLVADGVVDMGQIYVFASAALREPLGRIGVVEFADARMLDEVRALAEPEHEVTFGCTFHCYPVEATDPATGLPRDKVYRWQAPGGTGSHSLPIDFLPGTLEPIDGHRVLVVVGPDAPGTRFTRVIAATRTFGALRADVSNVARLSDADARRWLDVAKARGRAL